MIRLFEANATTKDFKTNGLLMLKPLKQNENKQLSLNGWTIDVELPIKYSEELSQDMIVVAKTKSKDNPQAFRIKNIEKTIRTIKFQAEHVFYDARDYYLVDVRPTKINAHTALNYVNDRTDNTSPFTFYSNVNNTSTAYFQDRNLLEAMVTIEERWGGYYDIDNWDIKLLQDVGHDNGEIIAYGKNLEDIKVFEDWTNVVTRLYAVGYDGARFEERYLDSEIIYPTPYTKRVDFETEFEDEDRIPENLIPELRANAQRYLERNQYPRIAYEVKSSINQNMEIGDTIHIKHPLVLISTKVQEYDYDMISERVTKLTFGNYSRDVKKRFDAIKDSIDKVTLQTSKQEAIVHHQTDLINNMGKNGHVYRDENEVLILDALPKEEAKKVWRWNMGGLGFSENGIEGPYKQAWTMDGVFNTEFISAGSIMTNHLSSDVGASLDLTSNTSINQIVSRSSENNIFRNLNFAEGYYGWTGTGNPSVLDYTYIDEYRTYGSTFVPEVSSETKSGKKMNIFDDGENSPGVGRIYYKSNDPEEIKYNYSFRAYVEGNLPFTVYVYQYNATGTQIQKLTKNFEGGLGVAEHTFKLLPQARIAKLAIRCAGATDTNRLKLFDMMFNKYGPQEYKKSADEVYEYAESSLKNLGDEIEARVEKDGVISSINLSSEEFKINGAKLSFDDAVGKNVDLTGKLTTDDLLATGGTIGNLDLRDGKLTNQNTRMTKMYTQSDKDRIRDIIMEKVKPTAQDFIDLDINRDGILSATDMAIMESIIRWGPNPTNLVNYLEFGDEIGKIKSGTIVQVNNDKGELNDRDFDLKIEGSILKAGTVRANYSVSTLMIITGASPGSSSGVHDTFWQLKVDTRTKDDMGMYTIKAFPTTMWKGD